MPTWDNYSKFGECLQGAKLCCRALFSVSGVLQIMLFIFLLIFFMCGNVYFLKEGVCVCTREELRVSWRCAAVQGGGVFNKCMPMFEAAAMRRMQGPVVIYCCVCAQQRILGQQMALQCVMNEH